MKEKIRKLFSDVWTVPNVLTIIRLVLIPVFVWAFFRVQPGEDRIVALIIFAAASLTDMLDGYLARKLNQITDFGKLFDPLADKLMVVTALFCQAYVGVFPLAAVVIVAAKELIMLLGGIFMLGKGVVVYSNYAGKAAMVAFILSLLLSFFHFRLKAALGFEPDVWLLWITVGLALFALGIYAVQAVRTLRAAKSGESES